MAKGEMVCDTVHLPFETPRQRKSTDFVHACDISSLMSIDSVPRNTAAHLEEVLLEFLEAFARTDEDLGGTDAVQHRIDTGNAPPVRQPPRRIPVHLREEVDKMISDMLDKDVIRPSKSPWASPVVLVKKKNGDIRLCVDYRKLNSVTRKDSYPLPRIDETLEALSGSKWFSTLDLASGYWQVELHPEDRCKSAFTLHSGLYEFQTMPFGLTNAPATFQRLMQTLLSDLLPKKCLVYLDDIIVHGSTIEDHLDNLRLVFTRLREVGLKLKPAKCKFLQQEVTYLGHIVTAEGIRCDP